MFVRVRRWAIWLAIGYVGIGAMLWGLQRRLIYLSGSPVSEEQQMPMAREKSLTPWHDEKGHHLGWRRERANAPTMVVFHGNAALAIHRWRLADGLTQAGWSVALMEYPGYGSRTGSPSRKTLVEAGCDAVDRLAGAGKVYVLGESIGSGVACAVAAARPAKVAGLLLVTPFAKLSEVGQRRFPIVPVGLLMGAEDYDNRALLKGFAGPAAFVLAGQDEVVGVAQGRGLHQGFAGTKRSWEQPQSGHNNLEVDANLPWWAETTAFLRDQGK